MSISSVGLSNKLFFSKTHLKSSCKKVLRVSALALLILTTSVAALGAAAGVVRVAGFHLPGFLGQMDPLYLYLMITAGSLVAFFGLIGAKKVWSFSPKKNREMPLTSKEGKSNTLQKPVKQPKVKNIPGQSKNVDDLKKSKKKTLKASSRSAQKTSSYFADIKSSSLVTHKQIFKDREAFLASEEWKTHPPKIAKSSWVPDHLVQHLMVKKKDSALGVKYHAGDAITNMEALLHTFVIPICNIHMVGDYYYDPKKGHSISRFSDGNYRQVVLSAAIHPDFETSELMLAFTSLKKEAVQGMELSQIDIPPDSDKKDPKKRGAYDQLLQRHMIYHLMSDHCLPAKSKIKAMSLQNALRLIEEKIQSPDFKTESIKNKFVSIKSGGQDFILPLELLFNLYVEQLGSELITLDRNLPQGFVYTINPPKIFLAAIGEDARLFNRLQLLAFQQILKRYPLPNLRHIAFSAFADPECLRLYQKSFSTCSVSSKDELFSGVGNTYNPPKHLENCALVIHNNSDGFGQNIETEGMSSLDGVIGSCSDAACCLKRDRADLVSDVVAVNNPVKCRSRKKT